MALSKDFSRVKVILLSHSVVQLFAGPWTVACQASPTMGSSRQGYWSGLLFPSPGILPTQGQNPCLLHPLHWQADPLPLSHLGSYITVTQIQPCFSESLSSTLLPISFIIVRLSPQSPYPDNNALEWKGKGPLSRVSVDVLVYFIGSDWLRSLSPIQ